ncbi:MAG: C39 family peptidase [Lachnospiraceae bacterium]|nr:C39 family peptidase [Lachnospiraceae bacterium]
MGGITWDASKEKFPLLLQSDKRWSDKEYGDDVMEITGCAPTCLSMAIIGLTGDNRVTPDVIADYAYANGYYVEGVGTSWSIMTEGGKEFGVTGQEIPLTKSVITRELEEGHPIVCSVGAGDFTTEGHFILLTGVEGDKIKVNDPNSEQNSTYWDYEQLEGQIKGMWALSKA